MRSIYILVGLNAFVWGAWFLLYNHGKLTRVGSYFAWWYDDLPVAFLVSSVALPLLALALGAARWGGARIAVRILASVTLLAILPYACFSGGGI